MFHVTRAHLLPETAADAKWLIEELWTDEAVGIIGGEPKCCKSFMALTLAVSVASGRACLNTFAVPKKGRVLLYAAEDSCSMVKERLNGICQAHDLLLAELDIHVITETKIRLDVTHDYDRLEETVLQLSPALLLLDPFVRLHQVDENSSAEIVPLLAKLRHLQRTYHCAIMVVHHAKKGAHSARAGQALRGSSEFHAWGDANLYLRRNSADQLELSVEHRAAPSIDRLQIRLNADGEQPFLELREHNQSLNPEGNELHQSLILRILQDAPVPLRFREIREKTGLKTERVSLTLRKLCAEQKISHSKQGYQMQAFPKSTTL